ncbi:hypothetical protein C5B96_09810 [Subtercola sp. Z020]|uniref:DUF1707 SHOCT-like domain-containing protein n=1 Tax=Subtercola sp. Z020 TaxID=2080582 RepID=UPI000CE8F62A|nr:DUF1707 domain-containing protein [Subtercola sp. Z020]PPF82239.1 hypothetical protein C5B96_09810 [Subtercola sp. Z020]
MTDSGTSGPDVRLSNAERDEAVARLNANQRDGRLSEAEFDERTAAVRKAVLRSDLAPLFRDLPADPYASGASVPGSAQASAPSEAPAAWGSTADASTPMKSPSIDDPAPRAGGRSPGLLIVSLAPFVALVLFLITSWLFGWEYSWLWFILIPVAGVIVYGGGWSNRSQR